jgi:hypothetical protein
MSFKALETDDFVVSADSITAGLWYGNEPELLHHLLLHLLKLLEVQVIIT